MQIDPNSLSDTFLRNTINITVINRYDSNIFGDVNRVNTSPHKEGFINNGKELVVNLLREMEEKVLQTSNEEYFHNNIACVLLSRLEQIEEAVALNRTLTEKMYAVYVLYSRDKCESGEGFLD